MKTNKFFLVALIMMCAMTMTTVLISCSSDNNDVTEPIEYGKVYSYAYEGNTLYFVIDEASLTAKIVAPSYPDYPEDEDENVYPWQGYEQPKGSVTVPQTVEYGRQSFPVTVLEEFAFVDCDEVTDVRLPQGITSIGLDCFRRAATLTTINIPETVTFIDEGAFDDCISLKAISIPAGVKTIEGWTFWGCESLETIDLPEGLTTIGYSAFSYCSNLTDIKLPSTLTTIDDYAFLCAETLGPNVIVPEGVTEIGYSAFAKCNSIESVTLPNTLQSIGAFAMAFNHKLSNVVFPDHLSHLATALLYDCPSLTTCHLPAQMEYIDDNLFWQSGITHLDVPEHVTRIEEAAFESCLSLRELSLPAALTEIADGVFANGTVPEKLILASEVPPTVKESAFTDYTTTIIVPKGAGNAYRSHDIWGRFANITEKE